MCSRRTAKPDKPLNESDCGFEKKKKPHFFKLIKIGEESVLMARTSACKSGIVLPLKKSLAESPLGAAVTMIVLAIYFGLLSRQRPTNAWWQAVWCGVIFNWGAGTPSPPSPVPEGGGWMGRSRLGATVSLWIPPDLSSWRLLLSFYYYSNIWWFV